MSTFTIRSAGAIAAATFFGVALSMVALPAIGAEQATAPAQTQPTPTSRPPQAMIDHDQRAAERSEGRIKEMHDRLHITSAQEEAWSKVAKIMRENSAAFRAGVGERYRDDKLVSAVDDLKSFQMIADEHSNGLKKLIPAFEALYGGMAPDQQKRADRVFAHRGRRAFN